MAEIANALHGNAALYSADGERIASAGGKTPKTISAANAPSQYSHDSRGIRLADGRQVIVSWGRQAKHFALGWVIVLALLIALGTWPIARHLTRRLEHLQQQADAWGEGRLSTRMVVEGCDEVAELARRFNQAAERVEALVNSQRAMLASASHELRSPLSRIRMATELLASDARPDLQAQIEHDIAELDTLIGDLLLASRLADDSPRLQLSDLDLLGLAAEEASRVGASATGESISIHADARLLRHLLRNLLENARRYGAASESIEVEVLHQDQDVLLRVLDRGPGIPESEHENIFEAFYRLPGSAERGEGAGYGLALVRRIARLHGGDVSCHARDGGGASFELRLPLPAQS